MLSCRNAALKMTKKETVRREMLRKLRRQSARTRRGKSRQIQCRLQRLPLYRRARSVLCYVSVGEEVETVPLLLQIVRDGKKLAVPRVLPSGRLAVIAVNHPQRELIQTDLFGIPAPLFSQKKQVALKTLDLVIVPGVAFDAQGGRLGRGFGYFDRFLSRVSPKVPRVGLAFEAQILEKVPVHSHDEPMQAVITEKQTYENPHCR